MITLEKTSDKNLFNFNFYHKEIEMTFCELLIFRNKINSIDISSHFYDETNQFGVEIVSLCNLKHVLVLHTDDILKIKSIMEIIFTPKEFVRIF